MADPYPFEKLSDESKQTLVGAQREAERAGKGYIGTEHILLAMLRLESTTAYRILTRLEITFEKVETRIATAASSSDGRPRAQQVIPTSRVKRMVELAFAEARRMNREIVDSGHLLVGLALEGEGIATLVLQDLGATAGRVIAEVEREGGFPLSGRGKPTTPGRRQNADLPEPSNVVGLRDKLASVRFALKHAVDAKDTEHALKLGSEENKLERQLDQARQLWLDSLG